MVGSFLIPEKNVTLDKTQLVDFYMLEEWICSLGGAFYRKVGFEIRTQGDPILWYLQIPKT